MMDHVHKLMHLYIYNIMCSNNVLDVIYVQKALVADRITSANIKSNTEKLIQSVNVSHYVY